MRYPYEFKFQNRKYRITIDSDISVYYDSNNFLLKLIPDDKCILEIKGKNIGMAIFQLLGLNKTDFKFSQSKYKLLKKMINMLAENKKGEIDNYEE